MKKNLPFLLIILFVSGCSSPTDSIDFSIFSLDSPTIVSRTISDNTQSYILDNRRIDTDDLLSIVQQPIDSSADLSSRIQSNTNLLQQTYPLVSISDEDDATIQCGDDTLPARIVVGSFSPGEDKDPLYFVQYFFIHDSDAYAIMYSSLRKSAVNQMQKYMIRLRCQPL